MFGITECSNLFIQVKERELATFVRIQQIAGVIQTARGPEGTNGVQGACMDVQPY